MRNQYTSLLIHRLELLQSPLRNTTPACSHLIENWIQFGNQIKRKFHPKVNEIGGKKKPKNTNLLRNSRKTFSTWIACSSITNPPKASIFQILLRWNFHSSLPKLVREKTLKSFEQKAKRFSTMGQSNGQSVVAGT